MEIKKISDMGLGYANILILGESGSGKTHFASTYPHDKILYFNILQESGALTLRSLGADLDLIEISNYTDMKQALAWLKNNDTKYDVLFIDSLSQWQKAMEKEIPAGYGGKTFEKWLKVKENTKEIIDMFKKLPFHKVFTCEIVRERDEDSGTVLYVPSLSGSARMEIIYFFDEVYYFTRSQEKIGAPMQYKALTAAASKYPCKSRLGMPPIIENPQLSVILENTKFKKIDKTQKIKIEGVKI